MLVGKGLISQDVVENLLCWQHSGFSVHGEVQVPDRDAAGEQAAEPGESDPATQTPAKLPDEAPATEASADEAAR